MSFQNADYSNVEKGKQPRPSLVVFFDDEMTAAACMEQTQDQVLGVIDGRVFIKVCFEKISSRVSVSLLSDSSLCSTKARLRRAQNVIDGGFFLMVHVNRPFSHSS